MKQLWLIDETVRYNRRTDNLVIVVIKVVIFRNEIVDFILVVAVMLEISAMTTINCRRLLLTAAAVCILCIIPGVSLHEHANVNRTETWQMNKLVMGRLSANILYAFSGSLSVILICLYDVIGAVTLVIVQAN
jgi:hypothetical protein